MDVPVPQRGVRHEQAAQRRDVPGGETVQGGKIAMFMTQEEKAREEEKAQLTAKGGDAVAGMGRSRRPAAQNGLGTASSFSLRRGLGLLEDGLNAAALGAEAIESDMPGKQFIDASPDGTDGSWRALGGWDPVGVRRAAQHGSRILEVQLKSWRA